MATPFVDQSERDYTREQEARERVGHLKLVRDELAGGAEVSEAAVARLSKDFAEATGSKCHILARFAETEDKFPDFSKRVGDLLDALIAAAELYGAERERVADDGFVYVTDDELAALMGCSTKTVQNARNELRSWPNHTKVAEIKEHWRDKDTLESHPHRYRVHLTRAVAEAVMGARTSPRYDRERAEALRDVSRDTADSARGFVARPAKRRKKKPDSALLLADVEAAVKKLKAATARQSFARNVDLERLETLRDRLADALAELETVYGLSPRVSKQLVNTENTRVETEPASTPDVPSDGRRVETDADERDGPQVEKLSTQNDSTESITYDFSPVPYVRVEGGAVRCSYPPGASDDEIEAINAEVRRVEERIASRSAPPARPRRGDAHA